MKLPLKGKPFTAISVITASAVTTLFLIVWVTTGAVNLTSSLITLGIWWIGAAAAAGIEGIAQEERKNENEHR